VLDRFAPGEEAFVAWVVATLCNCSREEASLRLTNLPLILLQAAPAGDAIWAFRRFRNRAEIRAIPCPARPG
jgi:hypothetical protein